MFYKTCCLLVIGLVVTLNRQAEANDPYELPYTVVAQLQKVVRLMGIWLDDNRDFDSDDFKNHFNQLGKHVSYILSLTPPEDVDFSLWQLNMLANQIDAYYQIRFENDARAGVSNSINDQLYNFLQMVETRFHTMLGFYQNIRGTISRQLSKSKYSNKTQQLLETVIPAELNKLDQCISAKINENAAQADISMYHPSNIYLNDIVASPANLQLMSDSLLVQWDAENVQYYLDIKYKTAVYECGDTIGFYQQMMSLRYYVYVEIILASVVAHLDVHFNAYRLHALNMGGNTGHQNVWGAVVGMLGGFIDFFKPEYNANAVSEVYGILMENKVRNDPETLVKVCQDASRLLQGIMRNLFPVDTAIVSASASTSAGPRNTEDVVMAAVANRKVYPQQFMSVAMKNYEQLNTYLMKLYYLFQNVNTRYLEYFLNIFR